MIETFGATFFGVITSFSLWYLGTWFVQYRSDKQARASILIEIKEEIQLNIAVLDSHISGIPNVLKKGEIPGALSGRLGLAVYHYAINSGQLRLLSTQQRLTLTVVARLSEAANEFINNTETLLNIWHLKPQDQALRLANHRLSNLVESLQDKRKHLQAALDSL